MKQLGMFKARGIQILDKAKYMSTRVFTIKMAWE